MEQLVAAALAGFELVFDGAQVAVPAEYARAHAQAVQRRHQARDGNEDGDDGEDRNPHAVDEVREPEGQVALQERRAGAVITLGVLRERELVLRRARKLARTRNPAGAAMDARSGLYEELDDCRVRVQI